MKTSNNRHTPLMWNKNSPTTLYNFIQLAEELNLDFIIYIQEANGSGKEVWVCAEEDLTKCILKISETCYSRVQSISNALHYRFYDFKIN